MRKVADGGGGWRGCRRCQKRAKIGVRRCTGLGGPRTLPKQRTGVKGNIGQVGVKEGEELGSRSSLTDFAFCEGASMHAVRVAARVQALKLLILELTPKARI